jgi:hypothetical protein
MKATLPECPSEQSRDSLRFTSFAPITCNNAAGLITSSYLSLSPSSPCPPRSMQRAADCLIPPFIEVLSPSSHYHLASKLIAQALGPRDSTKRVRLLVGRTLSAVLSCWLTHFSTHSKTCPNVTPLSESRIEQLRIPPSSKIMFPLTHCREVFQ